MNTDRPEDSFALARDGLTGQAEFAFFNGVATEHWSYSFDVTANERRRARGKAVFNILENLTETQVVVKINCLRALTRFTLTMI